MSTEKQTSLNLALRDGIWAAYDKSNLIHKEIMDMTCNAIRNNLEKLESVKDAKILVSDGQVFLKAIIVEDDEIRLDVYSGGDEDDVKLEDMSIDDLIEIAEHFIPDFCLTN